MTATSDIRIAALVAVLRHKLVPATQLAELVEGHGDPLEYLRELAAPDAGQLFSDPKLDVDPELQTILREIGEWRSREIAVVSVFDEAYPLNLRTVYNRPAVLMIKGHLDDRDTNSVAVVGTRRASERGLARARKLASQLVEAGYVVVSGLADGVDAAAHHGALDVGGRTVAVIGTGHDHAFPKANAALQHDLSERSAVVSPFWPDQGPRPWTFPQRNAVMSGFALATVVVEASHTSGAKMQARLALEHGRPVFLLESLLEHQWAQDYAERPGVYVVAGTDEVVGRLERLYPAELVVAS